MQDEEMLFTLNPVNFFIISGILQNFVVCGVLFFRKNDHPHACKLLAVTILIVNLHLTNLMVLDTNLDNVYAPSLWIPYSYLTAIGPLIFLYTRSLTHPPYTLSKADVMHFIPVSFEIVFQIIQIAYSIHLGELYYNTPLFFYLTPLIYAWTAGSIFWYLRRSLTILQNHENRMLKNFSNLREVTLKWLSRLLKFYRMLWILWIPFIVAFLFFFRFQTNFDWPVFLGFVIVLYTLMLVITYLTFFIGLEGLVKMNVVFLKGESPQGENKNYDNLSQEKIDRYKNDIKELMVDKKIFLNENLTLRDLALSLNAEPNLISYILNTHLKRNFYEFVNSYRIEEVKQKLGSPDYRNLTILAIALECGFNSKTSFNRVFKQMTGLTPSQYVKENLISG